MPSPRTVWTARGGGGGRREGRGGGCEWREGRGGGEIVGDSFCALQSRQC